MEGAKGTVTPLSEIISVEEAEKAAKHVTAQVDKQRQYLKELQGYSDETTALSLLVAQLPDVVSHKVMVLLGEGYYSQRSAKQTVSILERRTTFLEEKINHVRSHVADLEAEAQFAMNTANEAKSGVVEIREQVSEEPYRSQSRSSNEISLDSAQVRGKSVRAKISSSAPAVPSSDDDEEHSRIMARLEALEAAEEAAWSRGDEEQTSNGEMNFSDHESDAAVLCNPRVQDTSGPDGDEIEIGVREVEGSVATEEWSVDEAEIGDMESNIDELSFSNPFPVGSHSLFSQETEPKGLDKPQRPISRFGREVQSAKKQSWSQVLDERKASLMSTIAPCEHLETVELEKVSCPFIEGSRLVKLKDWRSHESSKQGFVLGSDFEGRKSSIHQKDAVSTQPVTRQRQAFTGTVQEHLGNPIFATTVEQSHRPLNGDEEDEEHASKPVSKFKQMRQAKGR